MGGKVVKNAAGFDLPKFFVGSMGRFGVLAEMTFKVFPRPAATLTLRLEADSLAAAAKILMEAAGSRFELRSTCMVWRTCKGEPSCARCMRSCVRQPMLPVATTSAPVAITARAFCSPSEAAISG